MKGEVKKLTKNEGGLKNNFRVSETVFILKLGNLFSPICHTRAYVCVLCSSHSSQGINNSFPGELDEALLGWFVHGLKADHNHPFCVRHSFWFSACIQGDYANIGVLVLSQTKVKKALSSVSISDRCQRESKSKENMYYKFPW